VILKSSDYYATAEISYCHEYE